MLIYVRDDARPIARELGFDTQRLGLDALADLRAELVVQCIDENETRTCHRSELRRLIMPLRGRRPPGRSKRPGERFRTHTCSRAAAYRPSDPGTDFGSAIARWRRRVNHYRVGRSTRCAH